MDRQTWSRTVAERLGEDHSVVDRAFGEIADEMKLSFDEPQDRPLLSTAVMQYERWMEADKRGFHGPEALARGLGITIDEATARLTELEQVLGRSMEDPVQRTLVSVAYMLYELHKDKLPPLGDPSWRT